MSVLPTGTPEACPSCRSKNTEHLESFGSVQGSELGNGEKVTADRFRRCRACGNQWIQDIDSEVAS